MGFTDSFFSGVGSFFTGALDFVDQFSQTNIGGQLLDFGLGEFADVIGLTPSVPNDFRGVPLGPLGSPIPGGVTNLQLAQFCAANPGARVPGFNTVCPSPQRGSLVGPVTPQLNPTLPLFQDRFAGGPRPGLSLPPVPSSQPFGQFPGTGQLENFGQRVFQPGASTIQFPGGTQPMAAFPTFLNASFPTSPRFQTAGLPALGGALLRQLPGLGAGLLGSAAIDAFSGGGTTPMFRATMAGARAQTFRATNPATGKDTFFRPAGKPVLWSSDIACAKRVDKIARRVRRKR